MQLDQEPKLGRTYTTTVKLDDEFPENAVEAANKPTTGERELFVKSETSVNDYDAVADLFVVAQRELAARHDEALKLLVQKFKSPTLRVKSAERPCKITPLSKGLYQVTPDLPKDEPMPLFSTTSNSFSIARGTESGDSNDAVASQGAKAFLEQRKRREPPSMSSASIQELGRKRCETDDRQSLPGMMSQSSEHGSAQVYPDGADSKPRVNSQRTSFPPFPRWSSSSRLSSKPTTLSFDVATRSSSKTKPLPNVTCPKCGNNFMRDSTLRHSAKSLFLNSQEVSEGMEHLSEHAAAAAAQGRNLQFEVFPVWGRGTTNAKERAKSIARDLLIERGSIATKLLGSEGSSTPASKLGSRSSAHASLIEREAQEVPDFCNQGVIHPNSIVRGVWDTLSLFLVAFDIVMIPLDAFFTIPQSSAVDVVNFMFRLFWTADLGMSSVTAYMRPDGTIVLDRREILWRYIQYWLAIDLIVVGVDWFEFIMRCTTDGADYAKYGKLGRALKIIRLVRLLRLVRMREIVDLICERINSEKLLLIAHICKLMLIIFMLAHLMACFWHGLGDENRSNTWVRNYNYSSRPWGDRYAMSLHWSVSQFSGGMDEITPENPSERVYAMVVLLMTFIIAAFFISSLTSSMTQLEILGSTNSQMLSVLRQYMHQHHISSKLCMRVQRNAQHMMKEQQRFMPEDDVVLLEKVSEPLRIELHFEIYSPVFNAHPFFKNYIKECPQVMRKVCHVATRTVSVSIGDVVFSAGEIPAQPRMYFVVDGHLEYFSIGADESVLQKGDWIAEASLWTAWMYRGDLIAISNSCLCVLDAVLFQDTVNEFHHHGMMDPKGYAHEFVTRLNGLGLSVSDLPFPMRDGENSTATSPGWRPQKTFTR